MNELRKIVRAAALSLVTLTALVGCATGKYAVMKTSEGSTNPEGALYDPKVLWYENQEPIKRPAWTTKPTGVQTEKDANKKNLIFIESVGEDKGPRSYYAAMKSLEDKARNDVREYIRGIEEQKAKKGKADSPSQLENRIQALLETAIRETTVRTLYWELHRIPDNLKAKSPQAEWYYLVWAEYSVPVAALESGTINPDKTAFDKAQLENIKERMKGVEAYFSRVDHLLAPHTEFLEYLKQYNKLLEIGFTLDKLTTLTAEPEFKDLRVTIERMEKDNDPTKTLRMFGKEQITFIQDNLPKPVFPLDKESDKGQKSPNDNQPLPSPPDPKPVPPTPEEKLSALKQNLDTLIAYFKDVDDKKFDPRKADQFRLYTTNYARLIEIETSLKDLKTLESNADWQTTSKKTAELVQKHNPFAFAVTELTDDYAGMLLSEKKLSEYMDTIWNWKLPTRAERAKAEVYTTKKGDTLVKIARSKLGLGLYWYWLWRCNYDPKQTILNNPDEIPPGTKLIIVPAREPLSPEYSVSQSTPRE